MLGVSGDDMEQTRKNAKAAGHCNPSRACAGGSQSRLAAAREFVHVAGMITVATCNNPMHAQMLKSVLEDSGIPALIANENAAQIMPHLILAMGGIRVQVAEAHEEEARKLIDDFNNAAGADGDTFPPAVC